MVSYGIMGGLELQHIFSCSLTIFCVVLVLYSLFLIPHFLVSFLEDVMIGGDLYLVWTTWCGLLIAMFLKYMLLGFYLHVLVFVLLCFCALVSVKCHSDPY